MRRVVRYVIAAFVAVAGSYSVRPAAAQPAAVARPARHAEFAARIASLSEPAGYFDTDNLISNESSYLHPIGALRRLNVRGGAYIGVGPDQNFSYIAAIRPRIAYLIDIRRDNMLQHLMFKALFERSRNRMEYLCRWLGYSVPGDVERWSGRSIDDIVAYLDSAAPNEQAAAERAAVAARVRSYGVPLDARDVATLDRFHATFQNERLDLRFRSHNRMPQAGYPTLRELILESDLDGKHASYLAREEDWQFVKQMQARDQIVPMVGDLSGSHALAAIAGDARALGEPVSALYVSNVEQYLWRDGSFARFAETAARLPRNARSVLIRSIFGRNFFANNHPLVRGKLSIQSMQTLDEFAKRHSAAEWNTYWDLVTKGAMDLSTGRVPPTRQ